MSTQKQTGSLFKNQRKEKETQPDYTGSAVINEKKYQISAWINTSQNGQKYFRLLFSEALEKSISSTSAQATVPMQTGTKDDLVDDLPF